MMTPAPIKSAGHAAKYFEETDDYYREGGKALSQWYGKGAEELGLKGKVEGQDLRDVLQGRLPNDVELGRSVTNKETGELEWKHRPGVDAQFAPPKTVSIAALVGGDDRLVEAHNRAVQTALKHYEDNFLSTRIRAGDGVVTREMTGKLVAATMLHETSRAQEPQLHTHSLIMNATQSQDGKWRSIDDRTVFVAQKTLGMVYKQALSHDAARLGYDVVKTSNQGDFDIKGIPKEIVNSFSSRSVQIEAALADRGKDRESANSAEKRVLALDTRLAKSYANHDELKKDWHKSALEKGFDAKAFVKDAEDRSLRTGFQETLKVDTASHADSAVKFAAEKLAERSAVFSERKLLEEATKEGMGKASIDDIRAAVARATHLIPKDTKEYNPVSKSLEPTSGYTTQKGQDIESRLLKAELQGRNQSDRIMPESEAKQYQQTVESRSQYTWTSSQRNATVSLLTNSDNVVGIQGYAGTAKTTSVLAAYKDALEERGYKVMGLAPTGSTAATLRESGGFSGAQTVSSHLLKQEAKEREEAKSSNDRSHKQPDDKAVDKWKASQQLVDGTAGFVGRGGAYYTRDLDGRWQKADMFTALVRDVTVLASRALGLGRKEPVEFKTEPKDRAQELVDGKAGFVGRGGAYYTRDLDGRWQKADMFTALVRDIAVLAARALGMGNKEAVKEQALLKVEGAQQPQKQVWVVDEASMLSSKDMRRLLDSATKEGAKLVLVGDIKQLRSVEAGAAFRQLQEHGMTTYKLDEIVRQNEGFLKDSVKDSIRGKMQEAVAKLGSQGSIIEKPTADDRRAQMVKDYMSLSPQDREKTLLIDPSREGRAELNKLVREAFKGEGNLGANDKAAKTLQNKDLTEVERKSVFSYESGDVVKFMKGYEKYGVEKGDYFTVRRVDTEAGRVVIEKNGHSVIWNPQKWGAVKSQVFKSEGRDVAEGDKIRFTAPNREIGVVNGSLGRVTTVSEKGMTVELNSGKKVELSFSDKQHQHYDHAYSHTVNAAQGMTADRAFYHAESFRANLTNQQAFYVGISRAKEEARVYTDSAKDLASALNSRDGQAQTALDANGVDMKISRESQSFMKEAATRESVRSSMDEGLSRG